MACPAFGSTSEVALFYAVDADPSAPVPANQVWTAVRMTGESLDQNITSTVSEEITPDRAFSDSVPTQGEITGGFSFEASFLFLDDWLVAALQSSEGIGGWATGETITNESTKACLMLCKRINVGGTYHYYVYRGIQVSSLSLKMSPGAIVTGDVSVMGVGGEVQDAAWAATMTFNAAPTNPLMSGVDSLTIDSFTDVNDVAIPVTFQELTITFDNQLRQQFQVGGSSIYAAGTASGRFKCMVDSTQYYADHSIYDQLVADSIIKMQFTLEDSAADSYQFTLNKLKVLSGAVPLAGGPDQDLLISPSMQAFQDGTTGTVSILKTDTP
jgi:hypothetical protein